MMSESREDGIFLPVLPAKHRFVDLLIKDMHQQRLHAGVSQTLSELRASYRIIKGRQRVKFVFHGCKRLQGPSFKQPVAPLPMGRCLEAPPFTISGLDFSGALFSKDSEGKEVYRFVMEDIMVFIQTWEADVSSIGRQVWRFLSFREPFRTGP